MSFIFVQNFSEIDDHKELSFLKNFDFKINVQNLNIWILFDTHSNDMNFFSHI
jgi:hypothetical protein